MLTNTRTTGHTAANCGVATLVLEGLKTCNIVSNERLFSYARCAACWRRAAAGWTQLGDFQIFISAAKSVKQPTVMVGVATLRVSSGQTGGTVGVIHQCHYIWPTMPTQTQYWRNTNITSPRAFHTMLTDRYY